VKSSTYATVLNGADAGKTSVLSRGKATVLSGAKNVTGAHSLATRDYLNA